MNKLDKLAYWRRAKEFYRKQGTDEELKKVKNAFGLSAMAKRRRWLKEQIKSCDEQIGRLEGADDY